MHHFSRRPARDQQLLCYLHDIKMRSDTARIAAAAARTDPEAMRDLHDTVMEEGFDERVVFARANPDSAEAAGLIRKLERVLLVKGSKVPFSPLERGTTAAAQIIAQLRHYGLPNTFITVGIDETRSTLIARLACSHLHSEFGEAVDPVRDGARAPANSASSFWHGTEEGLEPDFQASVRTLAGCLPALGAGVEVWRQEVAKEVVQDPVAIAVICHRLMEALMEELVVVPRAQKRTIVGRARAR